MYFLVGLGGKIFSVGLRCGWRWRWLVVKGQRVRREMEMVCQIGFVVNKG